MPDRNGQKPPWLPPRWFIYTAWYVHRGLYRLTGGKKGVWPPREGRYGVLRLTATGRRSGQERSVMLGYYEDGPRLVTMAMNGWGAPEPAWWLNLQAHPEAKVETSDGVREVTARAAEGDERTRLWARWTELDKNLEGHASRRPTETAVVIFEPRA